MLDTNLLYFQRAKLQIIFQTLQSFFAFLHFLGCFSLLIGEKVVILHRD